MDNSLKSTRSDGVTEAERYLKKLCERSFLSMWSYVGVFNDKGTGQEVCDLLVVFDNHVIVFSDKDCEFPNTGNLELDWKRWYKKAVKKSADQIYGAERWILKYSNRLFLDQTCKIPFPINLPSPDSIKIHRILVAHSASAKCAEILGGSGSLMIDTEVDGDGQPFTIGKIEKSKGYIHVLDDTSLDILLSTLDTISDFVSYLEKKEQFLTKDIAVFSTGEEELLATYLKDINDNDEHDFVFKEDISEFTAICLDDEGSWTKFLQSPQRKTQIQANEISYAWDGLIETFTQHIFSGTSYYNSSNDINDQEIILRFLARENRTRRRMLSKTLLEFIEKTPKDYRATRTLLPSKKGDPYYVFLLFPYISKFMSYEDYRRVRGELLSDYCCIVKSNYPDAEDIIGIATETARDSYGSEDAMYINAKDWTEENKIYAENVKSELESKGFIGKSQQIFRGVEKEYPDIPTINEMEDFKKNKGRMKNQPCPCQSGKKFKKCCGTNV